MDAETHNAPCPVVDDDEHPLRVKDRRVWCRIVPRRENASNDILVNGDPEGERDLLRDPRTSPARIPLLHVDHGGLDVLARSFGPRRRGSIRAEEPAILSPTAHDAASAASTV